jgi:hypothetical protein
VQTIWFRDMDYDAEEALDGSCLPVGAARCTATLLPYEGGLRELQVKIFVYVYIYKYISYLMYEYNTSNSERKRQRERERERCTATL